MAHPIFKDPPSTDMTAAQERQRDLDAQIEAFLAEGGKIQAFDHQARPTACTPWRSQSIKPRQPEIAPTVAPAEKVIAVIAKPACKAAKPSAQAEMRAIRRQMQAIERRINSMRAQQ